MELRVWAPKARQVDVDISGRRRSMAESGAGWWSADVPELQHGVDYAFRIDEGDPLPDPRSPWQPVGVHGPSRAVDHASFKWGDRDWRGMHLPSAVLYELHIGTFSADGTFDGAIKHLDHLVDLGITAIEVLPVAEFSGDRNWGYDGVDLYAPHHAYGGPTGFKRFVDACHRRGLGVVLDVVYNHLGPEGNVLGRYGPYFTDFYSTPWGSAVNYDQAGSHEVRRFVIDNALMWLRDYHVDGLRLDAVHAIVDTSAIHLLEQLAVEVEELAAEVGRPLHLIAESDLNDPRLIRGREAGGYGLDAQWSDDLHHALHALLTGETNGYYEDFGSLDDVADALEEAWIYAGRYSAHRDRVHGRPHGGLPGWKFLAYLQNHDQVGNRAIGDRITHAIPLPRAKVGAALYLLSAFVPMVFQGEEWAASTPFQYFTGHEDRELGRAVAQGRRSEFASFGWKADDVPDPQDLATFERSKLQWKELKREPHREMLEWYRALIQLRRTTPDLADGRLDVVKVHADDDACTLVIERGSITVVANLGDEEQKVELAPERGTTALLVSDRAIGVGPRGVTLPPDTVAVLGS
ncbi:MAG TPA: malto-oligosyltrehalose trehalohydrolase [Acidimicrobiales bacterium]|nr:malto-oligosyltrehalose trehalohydrolase [Acidimicrobiales bacterium]